MLETIFSKWFSFLFSSFDNTALNRVKSSSTSARNHAPANGSQSTRKHLQFTKLLRKKHHLSASAAKKFLQTAEISNCGGNESTFNIKQIRQQITFFALELLSVNVRTCSEALKKLQRDAKNDNFEIIRFNFNLQSCAIKLFHLGNNIESNN